MLLAISDFFGDAWRLRGSARDRRFRWGAGGFAFPCCIFIGVIRGETTFLPDA
jgi:hypothetical protein